MKGLWLVGILSGLILLSGAYAAEVVRVGILPVVPPAPLYVAYEKGYFKEQGIDARMEVLRSPTEIDIQLAAGNLDAARGTMAAATFNAMARGMGIKVVAMGHGHDPKGPSVDPLVVRKALMDEGKIKGLADLKGRKVAIIARGAISHYLCDKALRKGGLAIDDVEPVYMPFPDMVPALERGAVDAACIIAEPLASATVAKGIGVKLEDRYAPGVMVGVLFFNQQFMDKRPEVAKRFMVAYLKAVRDLIGEGWRKEEHVKIINKWTKVPEDVIKRMAPPYYHPDGKIDRDSLMEQERFFLTRGELAYKTPLPLDRLIDERFLEQALAILGK